MIKIAIQLFFVLSLTAFAQDDFWQPVDGPYGGCTEIFSFPNGTLVVSGVKWYTKQPMDTIWQEIRYPYPDMIYMGTTPDGVVYVKHTNGYAKTIDNGVTWKTIVLPDTGNLILQDTRSTLFEGTTDGLWYSTNHGETWIKGGDNKQFYSAELIGFTLQGDLLQSVQMEERVFTREFYVSRDTGFTWRKDTTLPFTTIHSSFYRISPTTATVIANEREVHRSLDNGDSWQKVAYLPHPMTIPKNIVQCGSTLYVGLGIPIILDTLDWHVKQFHDQPELFARLRVMNDGKLCATTETGVLSTSDCWAHWTQSNTGIVAGGIQEVDYFEPGLILAQREAGMLIGLNYGTTWQRIFSNRTRLSSVVHCPGDSSILAAIHQNRLLLKSFDRMKTWDTLSGFEDIKYLHGSQDGRLYSLGYSSVFRYSDNYGASWTEFPNSHYDYQSDTYLHLTGNFVATKSDIITTGKHHYDPVNARWQKCTHNPGIMATAYICNIVNDRNEHIYLTLTQETMQDFEIYSSEDQGKTWGRKWVFHVAKSVNMVGCHVDIAGGVYCVFSDGSVFRSQDQGVTWDGVCEASPNPTFLTDCTLDDHGFLWGSTHQEGLFRSSRPLPVESTPPITAASALSVYPNPAVNVNTITASITLDEINTGALTLEAVNELGAVLHTQQLQIDGRRRITANISVNNLPTGYYMIRVSGQGKVQQQGLAVFRK